ncbi:MAG: hypothetical protein ACI4UJ_00255 [Candidatus Cryptobacteroides sp.]
MKKFIISASIILLLFVSFFLLLLLTDTPLNLSLTGSGVTTLIAGSYLGLSILGKPLKAISTDADKLKGWKKACLYIGLLIVSLSGSAVLIETKGAAMESLPLAVYCIAIVNAVLMGIFTRIIFISLPPESTR